MGMGPEQERRAKKRFVMERDASYKIQRGLQTIASGAARLLNMSSSGVLFIAEEGLPVGREIELAIDWPAVLNNSCALKLVVNGRIVRCRDRQVAATIERYEFRTRASRVSGKEVPQLIADRI